MKLSTKGRYAVTALADIAMHGGTAGAGPVSLADIAARQDISVTYLEQLFMKLRRAGLVESVRGPGGGYVLAAEPGAITIAAIMAAVDETVSALRCAEEPGQGCGGSQQACLTHALWEELSAHVHVFLAQRTIADVIGDRLVPCPAVPDFIGVVDEPLEREAPA